MLLAIDIGNTNVTLGIFKYEAGRPLKKPVKTWRLSTNTSLTDDEYGTKILDLFHYSLLETVDIKGVAIANVVPTLTPVFDDMVRKYFNRKAFFVGSGAQSPIPVVYDNPKEVGADRIANAVAAYAFYGGPAIVIDFGTATTFDCINRKGEYIGGVIAPGPRISAESLARRTAKLPRVDIEPPARVIGKSTIQGIQSGLYYGYIGLVKEILKRIRHEMPGHPRLIATGGLARLIVKDVREVREIAPDLTLEGIRILWEKAQ